MLRGFLGLMGILLLTQLVGQGLLVASEALHPDNIDIEDVFGPGIPGRMDFILWFGIGALGLGLGVVGVLLCLPTILIEITTGADVTPWQ